MEKLYISYKCKVCNKTTILLTDEVNNTIKSAKYIACSHCGSKRIVEEKSTDNLKECMNHSSYKRQHGVLRQVIHE